MNWVIEHLQIIIGVAAAIAYFLNRRRAAAEETPAPEERVSRGGVDPVEQAERTRQIQAEIRRKIAERRGTTGEPVGDRTLRENLPPLVRPTQVPPLDPFGGPMRRILKELERASQGETEPQPDPQAAAMAASLERQKALQDEMRALEAARLAEQRRAEQIAKARRIEPLPGSGSLEPGDLRSRLRDPGELRRAIALREILGKPIALR